MTATPQDDVSVQPLRELHVRPPINEYMRELWRRRHYAIRVPLRGLRARNLDNALGIFWFVLNPLLLVGVYYLFFGVIIGTDRGIDNFLTFLASGVFTYSFLQRTMISTSRTIKGNIGLIRAIRFPRALLPISDAIEQTVAHMPVILVLLIVALLNGVAPRLSWLMLGPLVLLQAVFALGVGFVLARVTMFVNDVQSLLPFVFRLVFYMSGVLYSVDVFVTDPAKRRLFFFNPFFDQIRLVRFAVLGGDFPTVAALAAVIAAAIALPVGFLIFRRGEPYGAA